MPNNLEPYVEHFTTPKAFELKRRFTYHPPIPGQPERYEYLRRLGGELGIAIMKAVPDSRERSLAITRLEESIMWANAAIARNEKG